MKILLLGDASHYNATLAPALARLGHEVTVASDGGGWMQSTRQIDISRGNSPAGGAKLYWRLLTSPELGSGYDVVFICDTSFVQLKPHRLLEVFRHLKKKNGKVFLEALGTTALYVQNLTGPDPVLPFSEWQSPWGRANMHAWLTPELLNYTRYVYEHADGIATALYEYDAVARAVVPGQKIVYAGIPVVEPLARPHTANRGTLRILAASHPGREAEKGMDILLPLVYSYIRASGRPVELRFASGMPFADFTKALVESDIVIDQFYALSPATTALMAMRGGAIPVTGGHSDWLRFIGADSAPLIATDPRDPDITYHNLCRGIANVDALRAAAPSFAAQNSPDAVAQRLMEGLSSSGLF